MKMLLLLLLTASVACVAAPGGEPSPVRATRATVAAPEPREAAAILAIIQHFYEGMRGRDTTRMRRSFHSDGRLLVTSITEGQPVVRMVPLDTYFASIAATSERLDPQQTAAPEVRVSGNVATVWARYLLRRNGNLSHCGVDAFQLARTSQGWRVLQLFEMQQRGGCPPAAHSTGGVVK